jgi:hypothetical protein
MLEIAVTFPAWRARFAQILRRLAPAVIRSPGRPFQAAERGSRDLSGRGLGMQSYGRVVYFTVCRQ